MYNYKFMPNKYIITFFEMLTNKHFYYSNLVYTLLYNISNVLFSINMI